MCSLERLSNTLRAPNYSGNDLSSALTFFSRAGLEEGPPRKLTIWKILKYLMHLDPTHSLGSMMPHYCLRRASMNACPIVWHPVSGRTQRELWNLSSVLIHSPGRNIVTFMPLGLQKQLGSRAVLDIWWSNLSFLGRCFKSCCTDKALYRTTSWLNNCVSQCAVSSLLPSLICLTILTSNRSKRKDWPVLLALFHRENKSFLFAVTFWDDMQELQQKPEELALASLILLGTLQSIYSL